MTCLDVLCNRASDAPDLAHGARVLDASDVAAWASLSARWASCTHDALAASAERSPAGCGMPESPLSYWDFAQMPSGGDDIMRLVYGCAPRAAYLIVAARSRAAHPLMSDVLRRGMKSPNRWVFRASRRALLRAGDRAALQSAEGALRSPDAAVRGKAVDDFAAAGRAAQPHVASIVRAAPTLLSADRRLLVPFVLGHIGGGEAGQALAGQLVSTRFEVRTVVEACERLGIDAQAAAPALRALAKEHPFLQVRERAARAHESVTGEMIVPGTGNCPRAVRSVGRTWLVRLDGRQLRLQATRLSLGAHAADAGGCRRWVSEAFPAVGIEVGDACLLGMNRGEWGGWVEARDLQSGAHQRIGTANPLSFFAVGEHSALLLSGIGHIRVAIGWLDRISRNVDGRWVTDRLVQLDGVPIAQQRVSDGVLVLLEGIDPGCAGNDHVLVRVADDGRIAKAF